jgi:cold shock CspA family protein
LNVNLSLHEGDPKVWTRYRPRKGRPFFCDACKEKYRLQRIEAERALEEEYPEEKLAILLEVFTAGKITKIFQDKGYGYIRSKEGETLFFHATAVTEVQFSQLTESQYVQFKPRSEIESGHKYRAVEEVLLFECS